MFFTISFVVVIVVVGFLEFPSKSRKLPHTVNLLLCVSNLVCQISHTIRPYVTSLVSKGTSVLGMNVKLFVTVIIVTTS